MKILKRVFVCLMLMVASLVFFACELPTLPNLTCSGIVMFEQSGLEGVTLKSEVKDYAITNVKGEYTFNARVKKIKIIPEKEGYIFSPKFVEVTEGENIINFTAIKVEKLTGSLLLSKIVIMPTSILNSPDNFVFINNGNECLKPKDISIVCNDEKIVLNETNTYLEKNKQNEILITQTSVSFVCGEELKLGVLINAYFMAFYQEVFTTDTDFSYLEITEPQTNANLENGNIVYTLYGINNKARTFTFDISFVFNFIPNV